MWAESRTSTSSAFAPVSFFTRVAAKQYCLVHTGTRTFGRAVSGLSEAGGKRKRVRVEILGTMSELNAGFKRREHADWKYEGHGRRELEAC
jgi:hypothetical protein